MTTILTILSIVGLAFGLVEFLTDMFGPLKKPFGCIECTSFWVAVVYGIITQTYYIPFATFLITKIINKYLWK